MTPQDQRDLLKIARKMMGEYLKKRAKMASEEAAKILADALFYGAKAENKDNEK
jgi:hypothetical protein